jgi:hypothetical protein
MVNRDLLRRLAFGRICLGVAALVAPSLSARSFVGRSEADRPWTKLLARMAGVREIAIGLVALRALDRGVDETFVVGLSAICDAVDGISVLADRDLPLRLRVSFAGSALPFAAIEAHQALAGVRE